MFNFNYPVTLDPAEEGGFLVSFADVPEVHTEGDDEAEALMRAVDALETALEFYTDGNEDVPKASKPKRGQGTVRPSALACIKLSIYQGMRDQGVRKSELARRLSVHMPQVDRLLDLHHLSRLDLAERALGKLGYQLQIAVSPAGSSTQEAPMLVMGNMTAVRAKVVMRDPKGKIVTGFVKKPTAIQPMYAARSSRVSKKA